MTNTALVQQDPVIISLQRASTALAEAKTVQQTKKILDVAAAAEIYAKRQHLGEEAEKIALSIKVEALRKMGEILLATPKNKGVRTVGGDSRSGGSISVPPENDAPTLAELGLDKKESAVAQKLAGLSDEAFEQVREGHVTVAKALAAVDAAKKTTRATTTAAASTPEQRAPGPVQASTQAPARTEAEQLMEDAHGGVDLLDELERANAEIKELTEQVTAMSADDQKAEILKWRKAYDNAVRQQSEAMDRAKLSTDREAWTMRQLRRCGKAIGQDDPSKIAAAVEAFMREHKKVAA